MREIIRFAWGISSLGDFMVAMSDRGLVTLEFSSHHSAMEDALRARFPEADVIDSQGGLSDVLERVNRAIEEPGFDAAVPLDLRGTPYEVEVWSMLQAIPVGETTNYGALAAKLGTRDAREVTEAIACNPIAVLVPCHRVIKKDGSISGYRWGFRRKRELLAREQRSGAANTFKDLTEDCVRRLHREQYTRLVATRVSLSSIATHGPCSRTTEQAANRIDIGGF